MMYVDLDELPRLFKGRWLWSSSFPNLAWFRRSDYLGPPDEPLASCVRDLVAARTGRRPNGPVRLLTQFRYFGYVFNPLSLYYCYDENEQLMVIVAQVSNTPWGERHCYLIHSPLNGDSSQCFESSAAKKLHVSPFLDMDYDYTFRLTRPGKLLKVQIANWRASDNAPDPVFIADLSLKRCEISGANLCRALVSHPLMTQRVIIAIYWQALKLWWRGLRFIPHPNKSARTMVRPSTTKVPIRNQEKECAE